MNIKKGDIVKVISGDDKNHDGKVIKVFIDKNKILVQGVNMVWKHMKRSSNYPHGARIQKESPINVSNAKLVCPNCNKPTKVSFVKQPDGVKNRTCKKCKQAITT